MQDANSGHFSRPSATFLANSFTDGLKRDVYLHSLAKLAVIGLIICVVALSFWYAVTARSFDRWYAIDLLARHDSTIGIRNLVDMSVPGGSQFYASDVLVEADNMSFTVRDVTIFNAVDNSSNFSRTVSSEALWFGVRSIDIGPTHRNFSCPNDTWASVSADETANYLYVGVTGNWPGFVFSQKIMADTNITGGSMDATVRSSNLTISPAGPPDILSLVYGSMKNMFVTDVIYFSPSDRAAYDAKLLDVVNMASECVEVAA